MEHISAEFNNQPVELDETGIGTFVADTAGMFEVVAKAYDAAGNEGYASKELFVKEEGDKVPPEAFIESPLEYTKIHEPVEIIGTAYDENLVKYILEYSQSGKDRYIKFAEGTKSVKNDVLGILIQQ